MTTFARGVAKTVAINPETTFGSVGAGNGQLLRRVRSDLSPNVSQIESQEILPSQQVRDSRNGPVQVQGTIAGQLSPKTYGSFFSSILRNNWAAVTSITSNTDSIGTLSGSNLVVTSASANWTSKFHVGDMIRPSGFTGAGTLTAMNLANFRVISVTATVLTLQGPAGMTPGTWASGQTLTFAMPGQRVIIPVSGQLDPSFSLEHAYTDISKYELFTGCKTTQIALQIPASGFVQFSASVIGQAGVESGTQTFASAAQPTTTTSLTASSGSVNYNGAPILYIASASLQMVCSVGADPVVGSNVIPQIFLGTLMTRGSFTAFAAADSLTSDFLNEQYVSLSFLLTTGPASNADYVNVHLPRVKLTSQSKTDSDKAIMRSYNFTALENTTSTTGIDLTSVLISDSLMP